MAQREYIDSVNGKKIFAERAGYTKNGENLDEALRRFKRSVNKSGILLESRKREFYLKTGLRRKMKSEMARRKKW